MKKLIIIAGLRKSGRNFMLNALKEIIRQSGYTYTEDIKDEIETDFILIKTEKYDRDLEEKADLVFTSTRFSTEIMNELNCQVDIATKISDVILMQQDLIHWMRSRKHAYCMDFNAVENKKALYNYTTLSNLVLPLEFQFAAANYKFKELDPIKLIKELQKLHPIETEADGTKS